VAARRPRGVSRLSTYAPELVRLAPDVIMVNGTPSLAALQRATKTIFAQASDPVGGGFVASVAHPGGNITGFTDYEYAFAGNGWSCLKRSRPASLVWPSFMMRRTS
jgi:putative tryptophan/tyrosine transport system substrate-binding protein